MTFRRSGCRAGRIAISGNCCGIVTEWYILMTRQDVLQGFAQIAQPMEPIRDLHRAPWRPASGVGPGTITADHFRLDIAQTLAICRSSRFDIAQLHAICRSSPFSGRGYPNCQVNHCGAMSLRALHGQKVELLAFQNEPDRNRDCLPGLSPDHANLDLPVAGEAVFEVVLRAWHIVLPRTRAIAAALQLCSGI